MLEINNLSAFYGKNKVLSDINLAFKKGRFYAVVGRNSSGKSTLVRCIMSLMKHEGKILLDGKEIRSLSPNDRAKKLSLLSQSVTSVPFTALELVRFGRQMYNEPPTDADKRAYAALEKSGIVHLSDKKVNELSGGERQLCYFAMNLCQDADIMILDEPTSNLDIEHETEILSLAKKCCENGKTVICVLHNLSQAVRYADEIVILCDGKIMFSDSCDRCLEESAIEKYFGVKRYTCEDRVFFSE